MKEKEYKQLKPNNTGKIVNNYNIPLSAFQGFTSPEVIEVYNKIEWSEKEKQIIEKIKSERNLN
jgi:hypothetical protein